MFNKKKEEKIGGFEDDPHYKERCLHPGHQYPMHLYIPSGKIYRHICPGCGKETVLRSHNVTC